MPCTLTLTETANAGDAERLARTMSASDTDVVVACGGDGTVNEIVNGLNDQSVALGVIPLGTANVLAKEIGLGRDPEKIAAALVHGPIRTIHVGRANGRRFIMMAGVGFDAAVVKSVSLKLKKKLGPLAYLWESVRQILRYDFRQHEVLINGVTYRPASIVVFNGQRYGGPFIAAPGASLTDDCFHVALMYGRNWLSVLRYGLALVFARLSAWRDVELVVAREVVIGGSGEPVQADGDIVAVLPLRVTLDPAPVRLVYPA